MNKFWDPNLSPSTMWAPDQIQVVRLDGRHLYPLNIPIVTGKYFHGVYCLLSNMEDR